MIRTFSSKTHAEKKMNTGNFMKNFAGISAYCYEKLQEDWTGIRQVVVTNSSSHDGFPPGDVQCYKG